MRAVTKTSREGAAGPPLGAFLNRETQAASDLPGPSVLPTPSTNRALAPS
jgi:hypothetical protein